VLEEGFRVGWLGESEWVWLGGDKAWNQIGITKGL